MLWRKINQGNRTESDRGCQLKTVVKEGIIEKVSFEERSEVRSEPCGSREKTEYWTVLAGTACTEALG